MNKENKFVINLFEKNFVHSRHNRILIYGIGDNTRAILENCDTSKIVGLMDANNIGKVVLGGYKVFSPNEAINVADCIVIVARQSVVPIIYSRIKCLEDTYDFPIYTIEGKRIAKEQTEGIFENRIDYWDMTEEKLKSEILKHEIISFDIFDTLVVRKCMLPKDIFKIVEQILLQTEIYAQDFDNLRREAEVSLEQRGFIPTIDEIYVSLAELMNWNEEEATYVKKLEIETEFKYVRPREHMLQIFRWVQNAGKKVILISDMYLSRDAICNLLSHCGYENLDKIFVSCEEKSTKADGGLYGKVKELYGENILHIGDNPVSDIEMARKSGIDSFYIMSEYEMAVQSSLSHLLGNVDSLNKHIAMGYIINKLFDNPFALSNSNGRVSINNAETAGYVFMGPITRLFINWLVKKVKDKRDALILFCARDGYLIHRLYQIAKKNSKIELPVGKYFKTSRRAITVASINTEADIKEILEKPYNTTASELLFERFGVKSNKDDPDNNKTVISSQDTFSADDYILSYKKEIIINAAREQRNYKKYIEEKDLNKFSDIIVYDFFSGGTIQYYLQKIVGTKLRGLYFAAMNYPNKHFPKGNEVEAMLGNIGQYNRCYKIAENYEIMEAIFTDENGTLLYFDDNGLPVYDERDLDKRDYSLIMKYHEGIELFFKDTGEEELWDEKEMLEFTDEIFGFLFNGNNCIVYNNILNNIVHDSRYDFREMFNPYKIKI